MTRTLIEVGLFRKNQTQRRTGFSLWVKGWVDNPNWYDTFFDRVNRVLGWQGKGYSCAGCSPLLVVFDYRGVRTRGYGEDALSGR